MIPVLQFDPASQSLWYDPYLINRSRGAPEIGRALELAIIGDDPSLNLMLTTSMIRGFRQELLILRAQYGTKSVIL